MFYDRYELLCTDKGLSPSRAAEEIGLNKASVTNWKQNGYAPRVDILQRIATYFQVPVDFLIEGQQPFTYWDQIDARRFAFMEAVIAATYLDDADIELLWGLDIDDPGFSSTIDFIAFVSETCQSVTYMSENSSWIITPRAGYKKKTVVNGPTAESLSKEALVVAQDYDRLDKHSQSLIRMLINAELERDAEAKAQMLTQARQIKHAGEYMAMKDARMDNAALRQAMIEDRVEFLDDGTMLVHPVTWTKPSAPSES